MCIRDRNEARQGYRSGHYDRNLTTTSGDVTLHVPRLKGVSFETAIIERYRRRESSVEEALIEMYMKSAERLDCRNSMSWSMLSMWTGSLTGFCESLLTGCCS